MPLPSAPGVFLSYARKDGEEFATALRKRLADDEPEITLWQDRAHLEGGVGWWTQIEEALGQIKFLVIVMTPYAMLSENTAREWRYARQRGVIVYPVKGAPDEQLDYDALPNWMRKAHFFDLGRFAEGDWRDVKEWETFVNYLKSDREPVRVPFMAPDLPAGFVARNREFEEVRRLLLGSSREQPVAITTALQGAGGYGKTTLAIALCHDERVIDAFDDGVLWTSLGQTPRLVDELARLYEALTGERPAFIDATQAASALSAKLESRKCLVVIDDVWERAHLEPFLKGGTQCVRLVTTRKFDLVGGTGRVRVDEMTAAESIEVLGAVFPPETLSHARLAQLARRLGEWPLLMKLAAGMIRRRLDRGDSTAGALGYVERALDKRGVTAFDQGEASERDQAVRNTVAASLDQLSPQDSRRFRELAIFPEEVPIPLATLARLWGLDGLDTEECAQRLDEVALVKLDLQRGVVTLHDVMRAYVLRELDDVVPVHARLVEAYGDVGHPADDYAWRWLPYHLTHAGRGDVLRTLLLRPEWLIGKLQVAGPHALIADFDSVRGDRDLGIVHWALRLALPALARHSDQLWEQLLGRLPLGLSDALDTLRRDLSRTVPYPRLHARWPNLQRPGGALEQTLHHDDLVKGAMLLPDGRVLSWSHDATVRIWDLASGEHRVVDRQNISVAGARLLADGRVLTWGYGGALHVLDVLTGDVLELEDHRMPVADVVELPDGEALSWGLRWLDVWNLATGKRRGLGGHESDVRGALPLTEGRVLSWAEDGTLRLWLVASGLHRTVIGHDGSVTGALQLQDGRVLSWSDDPTLRIWDPTSGGSLVLTGHTESVSGVVPLPDGRLVSWSTDGSLRVWDVATGRSQELAAQSTATLGVLPLPDTRLLSWSADGALIVWDLASCESRRLPGHDQRVKGALLLADGDVLSWSSDGTLRVTDVAAGTGRVLATHHGGGVGRALLLPDARVLSWSGSRALLVWNPTAHEDSRFIGHTAEVKGALLTPDARVLSWSADRTLRMTDVATGDGRALAGHTGEVRGATLLPEGQVLSWSADGTLRLWDLENTVARSLTGHKGLVADVLVLPDERALSWGEDSTLRLWDIASGRNRVLAGPDHATLGALLLPDSRALSWSDDRTLRVWDLATVDSRELVGHQNGIRGALALPGARLLSWSSHSLRIWDLASGESQKLSAFGSEMTDVRLLPGGDALSWGNDDHLVIWDLATGEGRVLQGHTSWVTGALTMPDGRVLSWGMDGMLGVWDVATGNGTIVPAHQGWVEGAQLLPDGRVVTWSDDHAVRVARLDGDDQVLTFYFDASPTAVLHHPSGGLVVGDGLGRIHFLEML